MKDDILRGELSCGVFFDETFAEKLREQNYYHCIKLYLPEGMNVGGLVQEDLFRRVYRVYSAAWFAKLLEEQGYQIDSDYRVYFEAVSGYMVFEFLGMSNT